MRGAGVVEGGTALQAKGQPAADDADPPDQLVRHRADATDRHVILDLAHAVVVQEAGDEDVGVRPVELLVPEVVAGRGDAEAAALSVVQDGGEDAGRIEVRQAEPVDGAVHPHQRRRAQVADDAVVLDGLVARSHRAALHGWHPVTVPTMSRPSRVASGLTPTMHPPTGPDRDSYGRFEAVSSVSGHALGPCGPSHEDAATGGVTPGRLASRPSSISRTRSSGVMNRRSWVTTTRVRSALPRERKSGRSRRRRPGRGCRSARRRGQHGVPDQGPRDRHALLLAARRAAPGGGPGGGPARPPSAAPRPWPAGPA